jgi:exodeoxyribonuclease V beta subunit
VFLETTEADSAPADGADAWDATTRTPPATPPAVAPQAGQPPGVAQGSHKAAAQSGQRLSTAHDGAGSAAAHSGAGLLHAFPAGAQAGTFFHELLEWAAAQGYAEIARDPDAVRDAVARRCQVRNWSAWTEPLTAWLLDAVTRPMALPDMPDGPVAPVSLAGVGDYIAEMEFWLGADNVDVGALDRIVRAHTLDQAPRPVLEPVRINGMLKGFIDLVFEHQGRYYVLDYKSNRLGDDDASYTQAAMREAILDHRYELQYALYLFALHRLLRARLPDYDYDRHVGGAAYVFLRGTHAPRGGVFVERPPAAMVQAMDRLFSAARPRKEAA